MIENAVKKVMVKVREPDEVPLPSMKPQLSFGPTDFSIKPTELVQDTIYNTMNPLLHRPLASLPMPAEPTEEAIKVVRNQSLELMNFLSKKHSYGTRMNLQSLQSIENRRSTCPLQPPRLPSRASNPIFPAE